MVRPFIALIVALVSVPVFESSSQTVWTKHPGNPVLEVGSTGSWEVLGGGAPRVIRDADTLKMWYSGRASASAFKIGYAWSTDGGITWSKCADNPVMSPEHSWEGSFLFLADVVKSGGEYRMWYTAGSSARHHIGYATSANGKSWTRLTHPVLDPGPSAWDVQNTAWPSVMGPDALGHYKMWYSGHGAFPYRRQFGFATALDETTWTKEGASAVFPLGEISTWDDGGLESMDVIEREGSYEMWYSGYRNNFWSDARIGFARSPDGIHWTRHSANPVLSAGVPGSWDDVCVSIGDVLFDGAMYHMWYAGYDGSKLRIGYATAPLDPATSVIPPTIEMPVSGELSQNYPNPFNPETEVRYQIGVDSRQSSVDRHVRLSVFDVLGREVAVLVDEEKPAGTHTATWNATGFPSGVYFYQLRSGEFLETKRLIVAR